MSIEKTILDSGAEEFAEAIDEILEITGRLPGFGDPDSPFTLGPEKDAYPYFFGRPRVIDLRDPESAPSPSELD